MSLASLNKKVDEAINDIKQFQDRITEVAIKVAQDYPNIESVKTWEQIYAIETSYEGIMFANHDLHKLIEELRTRLDYSHEELLEISRNL